MGLRVKGGGAERFVNNAAQAGPSYEEGVKNPRRDWKEATVEGAKNYDIAIQKAIADKSFEKGVKKAGSDKWAKGALEKGKDRYASGVALAKDAYVEGMAPYIAEMEKMDLPPRFPKGDPRNIARVSHIAAKLHAKKKQLKG